MKAYKLTDKNNQTYNGCQWGENITHETDGVGELCGSGWIHFYDDPYLAVLFNPIHAKFNNPILWEIETDGRIKQDKGLKFGATKVTTLKQIPLPEITSEQKVTFGILCAKEVYKEKQWNKWTDNWLSGKDRTTYAAHAANAAAYAAAYAANAAAYAADSRKNLKGIINKIIANKVKGE
jgi:hypothetical protein